jgi:hypothetical protein
VLRHVTYQGAPLVKGKHVTGFTNGEEEEMHLTKVVPFLVEDELMRLGATDFSEARALTVRELGALSDLDDITVRIADVAAYLAVLGNRLRNELSSSTFP